MTPSCRWHLPALVLAAALLVATGSSDSGELQSLRRLLQADGLQAGDSIPEAGQKTNGTSGHGRFDGGGVGRGDGRNSTGFPGNGTVPGFNHTGDHGRFNGSGSGFNGSWPGFNHSDDFNHTWLGFNGTSLWSGTGNFSGHGGGRGRGGRGGGGHGGLDDFTPTTTLSPTTTPTVVLGDIVPTTTPSPTTTPTAVLGGLRRLREDDMSSSTDGLNGLPVLSAEIAARLADKAERMSDTATVGEEFWAAVREADWQLPPGWELPLRVTPTVGLARRSLREDKTVPEGDRFDDIPSEHFSLRRLLADAPADTKPADAPAASKDATKPAAAGAKDAAKPAAAGAKPAAAGAKPAAAGAKDAAKPAAAAAIASDATQDGIPGVHFIFEEV
ncbi:hypothetical protein WJX81_008207 [Elliptochloris bilobata]|uniref:Uncharacterized protein n=1 Tax=Elliptochloris bilobata TaxID=381761 RepID=A0AAW1S010_9CHLO